MTKSLLTISIDSDILNEFKKHIARGKVSQEVAEMIAARVHSKNKTVTADGAALLKLDLELARDEYNKAQATLRELEEANERIHKEEIENQKKALLEAAEKEEQLTKCLGCKSSVEDGRNQYKVKNGILCRSCFLSMPPDKLKNLVDGVTDG